jgi:hypothetical protein
MDGVEPIAEADEDARHQAWPTLAPMARMRRGGLAMATPTQDEASAESDWTQELGRPRVARSWPAQPHHLFAAVVPAVSIT